eukprot:jgi/Ulvmu1/6448/UM003_0078.1
MRALASRCGHTVACLGVRCSRMQQLCARCVRHPCMAGRSGSPPATGAPAVTERQPCVPHATCVAAHLLPRCRAVTFRSQRQRSGSILPVDMPMRVLAASCPSSCAQQPPPAPPPSLPSPGVVAEAMLGSHAVRTRGCAAAETARVSICMLMSFPCPCCHFFGSQTVFPCDGRSCSHDSQYLCAPGTVSYSMVLQEQTRCDVNRTGSRCWIDLSRVTTSVNAWP